MTVGERYQNVWQAAWDRQVPDAKGISFTDEAHRCLDAAVPGIWDAEVIEGQIIKGYDDDGNDTFGIAPLNGKTPYVWIGSHDDVVRLVVLRPKEGE